MSQQDLFAMGVERERESRESRCIVESRLKEDLSGIFSLPNVETGGSMADQPPGMQLPLFRYQRRSLSRMIEIESRRDIPGMV